MYKKISKTILPLLLSSVALADAMTIECEKVPGAVLTFDESEKHAKQKG